MTLQFAFAERVLYKDYDSERSERVELVKIDLKAPIDDILCIEI